MTELGAGKRVWWHGLLRREFVADNVSWRMIATVSVASVVAAIVLSPTFMLGGLLAFACRKRIGLAVAGAFLVGVGVLALYWMSKTSHYVDNPADHFRFGSSYGSVIISRLFEEFAFLTAGWLAVVAWRTNGKTRLAAPAAAVAAALVVSAHLVTVMVVDDLGRSVARWDEIARATAAWRSSVAAMRPTDAQRELSRKHVTEYLGRSGATVRQPDAD